MAFLDDALVVPCDLGGGPSIAFFLLLVGALEIIVEVLCLLLSGFGRLPLGEPAC